MNCRQPPTVMGAALASDEALASAWAAVFTSRLGLLLQSEWQLLLDYGVGASDCAQYLPPVFKRPKSSPSPPQTIISLPVHTIV